MLNNAEQAVANSGQTGIIRVEARREGERVLISVADNGSGIPAHVMPFIFDPFFTTKNLGEGTGLGLSIAHTLIESHGGSISAKSEPGNTVFTIELPMARSPRVASDTKRSQPLPRPSPRKFKKQGRVLVVDDETSIVEAISEFLDLQNIQVDKAHSGADALKLLETTEYDAVISDIRMPGIDGPELYAKTVARDDTYRRRFLFMSGDMVRDTTQGFVNASECPCLSKPFPLQVLFQHLQPLLGITPTPDNMRVTRQLPVIDAGTGPRKAPPLPT